MSEFVEVMKKADRMCDAYEACQDGCPISRKNRGSEISCANLMVTCPEKAEKTTNEWAAAHPAKTYLTDLLEKYPDTRLDNTGVPQFGCPSLIGLNDSPRCSESPGTSE